MTLDLRINAPLRKPQWRFQESWLNQPLQGSLDLKGQDNVLFRRFHNTDLDVGHIPIVRERAARPHPHTCVVQRLFDKREQSVGSVGIG